MFLVYLCRETDLVLTANNFYPDVSIINIPSFHRKMVVIILPGVINFYCWQRLFSEEKIERLNQSSKALDCYSCPYSADDRHSALFQESGSAVFPE